MARLKVDNLDLRILQILQNTGKVTNIQLSHEIGLSPAPTLERVKKLEQSGIIKGYHVEIDPNALKIKLNALIQVSLQRPVLNAQQIFQEKIEEIDEIIECYKITGNFDYMIKIMTEDIVSLEALITNKLSKIEAIGHMQTMIILSKDKDSKVVPAKYVANDKNGASPSPN